jgi:hypothetical protein
VLHTSDQPLPAVRKVHRHLIEDVIIVHIAKARSRRIDLGLGHYQVVVDKLKGTHFVVLNAWKLSPTLVERRRENTYVPNVDLLG